MSFIFETNIEMDMNNLKLYKKKSKYSRDNEQDDIQYDNKQNDIQYDNKQIDYPMNKTEH